MQRFAFEVAFDYSRKKSGLPPMRGNKKAYEMIGKAFMEHSKDLFDSQGNKASRGLIYEIKRLTTEVGLLISDINHPSPHAGFPNW